jgi:hypothetical protein
VPVSLKNFRLADTTVSGMKNSRFLTGLSLKNYRRLS